MTECLLIALATNIVEFWCQCVHVSVCEREIWFHHCDFFNWKRDSYPNSENMDRQGIAKRMHKSVYNPRQQDSTQMVVMKRSLTTKATTNRPASYRVNETKVRNEEPVRRYSYRPHENDQNNNETGKQSVLMRRIKSVSSKQQFDTTGNRRSSYNGPQFSHMGTESSEFPLFEVKQSSDEVFHNNQETNFSSRLTNCGELGKPRPASLIQHHKVKNSSPSSGRRNHSSPSSERRNHPSPSSGRRNHPSPSSGRRNHPSPSSGRRNHPSPSSGRGNHSFPHEILPTDETKDGRYELSSQIQTSSTRMSLSSRSQLYSYMTGEARKPTEELFVAKPQMLELPEMDYPHPDQDSGLDLNQEPQIKSSSTGMSLSSKSELYSYLVGEAHKPTKLDQDQDSSQDVNQEPQKLDKSTGHFISLDSGKNGNQLIPRIGKKRVIGVPCIGPPQPLRSSVKERQGYVDGESITWCGGFSAEVK